MENHLGDHFDNLSQDTKDVIKNSIEFCRLDLFKKSALSIVSGGRFVLKVGILILVLFFVSLGFAFLIGDKLGSVSYGFFIVGGFYGIILIIVSIFGKKLLEKPVFSFLNSLLSSGTDLDEELKKEFEETETSD
jgi:uncharacterized membrane protein